MERGKPLDSDNAPAAPGQCCGRRAAHDAEADDGDIEARHRGLLFRPRRLVCARCCRASIRARQAEHMLGQIAQDEIGRDRRHLVKPGFAEFAFDVVFLGETEAAVGLHAGLGRGP